MDQNTNTIENEEIKFINNNSFFSTDQVKVENGHIQITTDVTCQGSGEKEKITIEFGHAPTFNLNYESEQIKKIKESGLIPEDEIKFENGYMFFKDGGFSIDTPHQRDFTYKYKYIQNRDKKTKDSLQDKQLIEFHNVNHDSDKETDSESDNEENTYGLSYTEFLANNIRLKNPDEIVLEQSYISVHFNSPNYRDHTTFTIHADDEMKGFTRKELAIKCMKYYHMQYYLCRTYDLDKGCFVTNNPVNQMYDKHSEFNESLEEEHRKNPSMDWLFKEPQKTFKIHHQIFSPVLYYDEYTDNGLNELEYNKEKDYWIFVCLTYI